MGNAGDEVKAAATYVTDSVGDDGILRACERLGLVDVNERQM
ncbi:HAD hydrolase family protein [Collinsella tanakaei]|nr:HAD hydrolase family protein [Collinsella tanakaei]MDM8302566.1 HAD hydrolase family protein [Collinsella tanakaei]